MVAISFARLANQLAWADGGRIVVTADPARHYGVVGRSGGWRVRLITVAKACCALELVWHRRPADGASKKIERFDLLSLGVILGRCRECFDLARRLSEPVHRPCHVVEKVCVIGQGQDDVIEPSDLLALACDLVGHSGFAGPAP